MHLNQRLAVVYHPQFIAVYHQNEVLYIIKPQERYTLKRDDIQYRLAGIDDIQPNRADDILNLRFG